jgi:hypothetical protein
LFTSAVVADVNAANNADLEEPASFDHREVGISASGQTNGPFTRTWNIADSVPKAGMKSAVVIVSWTDKLGNHKIFLRTIL